MDRDREYARIVRESGLVPAEKVRAALRRVALMKARGLDTDLLRDLIVQDLIDEATAERVRHDLNRLHKKKITTTRIRAESVGTAPPSEVESPAPPPPAPSKPPISAGISAAKMEEMQEQAQILQFASLVGPDKLAAGMRAVKVAHERGETLDLLDWLVAEKAIGDAHAKAVRLKIQREANAGAVSRPNRRRRKSTYQAPPSAVAPPSAGGSAPLPARSRPEPSFAPSVADDEAAPPVADPPVAEASPPSPSPPPPNAADLRWQSPLNLAPLAELESAEWDRPTVVAPPSFSPSAPSFFDQAVVRAKSDDPSATDAGGPSRYESAPELPRLAPLIGRGHDRALGLLISESGLVRGSQLEVAKSRIDVARRNGRQTDLARELVAIGAVTWDDLFPFLENLVGREKVAELRRQIASAAPSVESGSATNFASVPPVVSLPATPPSGPPLPPLSGTGVRRAPVDLPRSDSRPRPMLGRGDGEFPPTAPAPIPPPPPDGPKPVQLRDLSARPASAGATPTFKPKAVRAKPARPRPKPAPKNTLQVQQVPALPPSVPSLVNRLADPMDRPVAELVGDIGEDRFSVTNALGLRSTVDLRPADEARRDADFLPESSAEGISPQLVDRLADSRAKYHLREEIGRGGMGTIIRALDRDVRRDVAMKILTDSSDRERMHRFLEEAQITGQLEHPNIVPIHDVGLDRHGQLFFTMKLVKGESLAEILSQIDRRARSGSHFAYREFTPAKLLDVFLKACDAVAFAHSKSVIHRDLKPENLMVGEYGEVLVMDWGVAKILQRDAGADAEVGKRPISNRQRRVSSPPRRSPSAIRDGRHVSTSTSSRRTKVISDRSEDDALQSRIGDVTGTPQYMPPEQAQGLVHELDERADIYSLGAILYEILTLRPPFDGDSVLVVLRAVVHEPLIPPSERAPERGIARELDAIVMKAMEKSPKARYATVADLQADVQAYLDGRRIATVEYSPVELLKKWLNRHKAAASAATLAAIVLVVIGLFGYLSLAAERDHLRRQSELATAQIEQATTANQAAEQLASLRAADTAEAQAARESARRAAQTARREHANRLVAEARFAEAAAVLRHAPEIPADEFGRIAAVTAQRLAYPTIDTGRLAAGNGRLVAVSTTFDRWLTYLEPSELRLVSATGGRIVARLDLRRWTISAAQWARIAVDPDFRVAWVAAVEMATQKPVVLCFQLGESLVATPVIVGGTPGGIHVGPDGRHAYVAVAKTDAAESQIVQIDARTTEWRRLATMATPTPDRVRIVAIANDGAIVATPHGDIARLDFATNQWRRLPGTIWREITASTLSPDGSTLVVAASHSVALIELATGTTEELPSPANGPICRLFVAPLPTAGGLYDGGDAESTWRIVAVTADGTGVEWISSRPEAPISVTQWPAPIAVSTAYVAPTSLDIFVAMPEQFEVVRFDSRALPTAMSVGMPIVGVHPESLRIAVGIVGNSDVMICEWPTGRVVATHRLTQPLSRGMRLAFATADAVQLQVASTAPRAAAEAGMAVRGGFVVGTDYRDLWLGRPEAPRQVRLRRFSSDIQTLDVGANGRLIGVTTATGAVFTIDVGPLLTAADGETNGTSE